MERKINLDFKREIMGVVATKLPQSLVRRIDEAASAKLRTRSDLVRALIVEAATARGWVEPNAERAAA